MSRKDDLIDELDDGAENAKNADIIERDLAMDSGRTNEPTRLLITECILDDKYPIGSGSKGFFLIDSEAELNDVVRSLESRIHGLRHRINALREGWHKRIRSRENGGNWPK